MTGKLERISFILEINKTQFKTTIINKKRKHITMIKIIWVQQEQ